MDIGLGRIGQIVVDNGMELADVDAPCGDVGGHHDLHLSRLEIAQGPLALPLRLVSVDRFAAYASPFQHAGDVVRAVLRAREYEHLLGVGCREQVDQQLAFFGFFGENYSNVTTVRNLVPYCNLSVIFKYKKSDTCRLS